MVPVAESSRRFVRNPEFASRRVAGERILVPRNPRTSDPKWKAADLYVLNDTGDALWELLNHPQTVDDLARNLIDDYGLSSDAAASDVRVFIEDLVAIGALSVMERED